MPDRSRRIKRLAVLLEKAGWRVVRRRTTWKMYPADPTQPVYIMHETVGPAAEHFLERELRERGYEGKIP